MDLGGGGNGGIGGGGMMTADERKGGGNRLDFTSNGQTGGFHNSTHADGGAMKFRTPDGRLVEIRNVWADNLEREMGMIRELVERYPFVAMDTEFPGVVARPVGDFNQPDYQYQTLRCNVDMLKMIQLGLSFANEHGELPDNGCCTWQFNFTFNLSEDMYAHDSIQLLKNSGIDFEAHERRGIDLQHFGELLMTSGLVLMPNVTWLSFHSGYDFGYLLKLLTCDNLPQQETEFFDLLQLYFPKIYDIKFLVSSQNGFHGGLNKLAEELKVERIGPIHQAGSDSLLTEQVFLKVSDVFFNGVANLDKGKFRGKFMGQLYGYGGNQTGIFRPANKTPGHHNNGGLVGSAPGGGGNGTNSTALATTAGNNNNGSSNGNSVNSHNNNNSSSVTVAGLQASATNAAAAVAAAGGLSAGLSDANSSTSSAATVAIMVAGAAVAAANAAATAANAAANAVSAAVAAEASESGSVAAPAAPNAEGTASMSSAPGGAPVDTGATVSMTTTLPGAGEPGNATTRSSNAAFSGTGGNAANSSGDPSPGHGDSAAGVPSAAGGDGPPGVLRNGAGTPSS